jgi:hypothetical protein
MDPQQIMDAMHRMMIRREAALWFGTGRAIYALRLRKIFREAKWPVPEEIEQYLDACTERLCNVDLTSPEQVAESFGLDRKGRNAKCSSDQLAAAEHVFALKAMNPGRHINKIIDEVADHLNRQGKRLENGKDAGSFVRDAYYSWLKQLRRLQKTS